MKFIKFDADDIDNVLAEFSAAELDEIPFGVMQVDRKGRILLYNNTEADITGVDRTAAIDRNFFTEIAPCTNQPGFKGRFDEGVRSGNMNIVMEWRVSADDTRVVQVHMKAAKCGEKFWIFTKRL